MRKIKGSPQPFGVDIKGKNINFAVQVAKGKTCDFYCIREGKKFRNISLICRRKKALEKYVSYLLKV
mgnify:CR=1 FL=1